MFLRHSGIGFDGRPNALPLVRVRRVAEQMSGGHVANKAKFIELLAQRFDEDKKRAGARSMQSSRRCTPHICEGRAVH